MNDVLTALSGQFLAYFPILLSAVGLLLIIRGELRSGDLQPFAREWMSRMGIILLGAGIGLYVPCFLG